MVYVVLKNFIFNFIKKNYYVNNNCLIFIYVSRKKWVKIWFGFLLFFKLKEKKNNSNINKENLVLF